MCRYFPTESGTVRFKAVDCTVAVAHTAMDCVISVGAGARVSWVVTIGGQSSSSPSTSFGRPVITSVSRPQNVSDSMFATHGGDIVLISGVNFASTAWFAAWSVTVLMLPLTGGAAVPLIRCSVLVDFVSIACTMPPGSGSGYVLTVTVLKQTSDPSTVVLSYAPPNITGIVASPGVLPSDGGAHVVISGADFGVGSVYVYTCSDGVSLSMSVSQFSGAACVMLPALATTIDDFPLSVLSPPLDATLCGSSFVLFFLVVSGQSSRGWAVPVEHPTISAVTSMDYATLTAAAGASKLSVGASACFALLTPQRVGTPSDWSVLQIAGHNLGTAAAIGVPVVSILPSDRTSVVSCTVCSLSSITALCIAMTASPQTRNGLMAYVLGDMNVTFGLLLDVTVPPRLLSLARDGRAGVVAVPGGSSAGLGTGDIIVLRFDSATNGPPGAATAGIAVNTTAAVDRLLTFSSPIGASYTGYWVSPDELRVVIVSALAQPSAGTAVGVLRVNVSGTGQYSLRSTAGTSPPSTSSGALEAGSWGDAVRGVAVVVRSSTQLYITITAPNLATYPSTTLTSYSIDSYVVSWGTTAAATGLGLQAVNFTQLLPAAATTSVTLSSLRTNTPVYVHVAVVVRVVTGVEILLCLGPFVAVAQPMAPVLPELAHTSLVSSQFMSTRGGDDVYLYGTAIGILPEDITASYSNGPLSFLATNCRVTTPGVLVVCSTSAGVGAGFAWRVSVQGVASNASSSLVSYDLPIVTDFAGPGAENALTAGGQLVTISGNQFGPAGNTYITRVQYQPVGYAILFDAVGCSVSIAHSQITCRTGRGAGTRLNWLIVIANQSSTTPSTRYAAPAITNITRPAGASISMFPTAGGDLMLISGTNLGSLGHDFVTGTMGSVGLYFGGEVKSLLVDCTVIVSDAVVRCAMPAGSGENYVVAVVVLGQASPSSSQVLSYAPPTLVSWTLDGSVQELPTQGGAPMQLLCANIGEVVALVRVFICAAPVQTPGCGVLSGVELDNSTLMLPSPPISVPSLLGTPQLYLLVRVGKPPGGASADTSRATGFVMVPVGKPTVILSQITGDFLVDLRDAQNLNQGEKNCVAMQAMLSGGSAPGDKAFAMRLSGTNLGSSLNVSSVSMVLQNDGTSLHCTLCSIAHTRAICLTTFADVAVTLSFWTGAQRTPDVSFRLADLVNRPSIESVSLFDPVNMSAIAGAVVVPTEGAVLLIRGMDFKNAGLLYLVRTPAAPVPLTTGNPFPNAAAVTACAVVNLCYFGTCGWGVDNSPSAGGNPRKSIALCSVPPGGGQSWFVAMDVRTLWGVSSVSFTYSAPIVATISPRSLPAVGAVISIHGESFGDPASVPDASVMIGTADAFRENKQQQCPILSRTHTDIVCVAPPGAAASVDIVVEVIDIAGAPFGIGYNPPFVRSVSPNSGGASGGGKVVINGSDFGLTSSGLFARFVSPISTAVPRSLVIESASDTIIVAIVPQWSDDGNGTVVVVSTGYQDSALVGGPRFFVDAPVLYNVSTDGPRHIKGGFVASVQGANLYGGVLPPDVTIGGQRCPLRGAPFPGAVTCTAPPGVGAGLDVVVTLMGRAAVLRRGFNYSAPYITAISPVESDARISAVVFIYGVDFAPPPLLAVLVSGRECASMQFKNSSWVVCTTEAGYPLGYADVVVYTGSQASNVALIHLVCAANYFAAIGDPCVACPPGGVCDGGTALPYPAAGWFQTDVAEFEACAPASACLGGAGSPCAFGYESERCKDCARQFYRLQDACVACPSFALLYIMIFLVVVSMIISVAYWLNKKRVNLAALSIGIDFMQVIAMFAAFNFKWPPLVISTLSVMSAAAFNLQALAPECALQVRCASLVWLVR